MDATQPLLFQGTLLNQQGTPVEGARVQMWQTDLNGNYLHSRPSAAGAPQLEDHASIVSDFQYFGTDATDENGAFDFLTYRPGIYSQRPFSHFHFMVWLDAEDANPALVTQFYFRDESPPFPEELHLDITPVDASIYGFGGYVNGTMVVADPSVTLTGGASLPVSPTQAQGPFYPEVDFFSIGNDLTTNVPAMTTATAAAATTQYPKVTVASTVVAATTVLSTTNPDDGEGQLGPTPSVNDTVSGSAAPTSSVAAVNCNLLTGSLVLFLALHLLS
ncbi:hypothetical protein ACHAXT_013142 [Thalassiosira profunda]